MDGGTFVVAGTGGSLELVEQDLRDGWSLTVTQASPDELRLHLTPERAEGRSAIEDVEDVEVVTVVVRLTATGIETRTDSRSTGSGS